MGSRVRTEVLIATYWTKVDQSGGPDACWPWTGHINVDGYGRASFRNRMTMAHRLAHRFAIGPIPEGYHVDHLCRVTQCCNPKHLEAVTPKENELRRNAYLRQPGRRYDPAICGRGHAMTGDNLYVHPSPPYLRVCKTCRRMHSVNYRARLRERKALSQ